MATVAGAAVAASGSSDVVAVELGDDGPVVIAHAGGFFVCRDPQTRGVGLGVTGRERVDLATMRQLLAGALASAWPHQVAERAGGAGRDLRSYVYRLCSAYQTTHATPTTMRRARDRFLAVGDQRSADFAEDKAVEESGHDTLALRDLGAMGLPAEQLVARIVPPGARALVAAFDAMSAADAPYGVFGYAYVLERIALWTTRAHIDQLQRLAPGRVNITRCAKTHSSVGADASHVTEMVAFIAGLPRAARDEVCRAAYRTSTIIQEQRDEGPSRAALDALLEAWQWQPFVGVGAAVA